jgi:hypothetical protein
MISDFIKDAHLIEAELNYNIYIYIYIYIYIRHLLE